MQGEAASRLRAVCASDGKIGFPDRPLHLRPDPFPAGSRLPRQVERGQGAINGQHRLRGPGLHRAEVGDGGEHTAMAQGCLGGEEVVAGGGIDAAREGFPEGVRSEIRGLDAGPEEMSLHDPIDLTGSQGQPLLSAWEEGRGRLAGTPLRQKAAQKGPDAFDQGDGAAAHCAAVHAPASLEAGSLHGDVAGDAAVPQADLAHGEGGELGGAEARAQAEQKEHLVAQGRAR